jgi:PAS domain S-box-containing protein
VCENQWAGPPGAHVRFYPPVAALILFLFMAAPALACISMPSAEMQQLDSFRRKDPEQAIAIATRRLEQAGATPSLDRVQLYAIIAFARGNESRTVDSRVALDAARRELSLLPASADSHVLELLFAEIEYGADGSQSEYERGLQQLDAVLPTVKQGSREWACLLKARSGFEFHLEKTDLAVDDALTAYRVAKNRGWDDIAAYAALELADAYRHAGLWPEAAQMIAEASDYLSRNDLTYWLSMAEYSSGTIFAATGQWHAAFAALDHSVQLESQLGDSLAVGIAAIYLCDRLLDAGRLTDAEARCPANADLFTAMKRNDLVNRLTFAKGRIELAKGHYQTALAAFDDIANHHVDDLSARMLPVLYEDRASALANVGRERDARIDLERSITARRNLNEAAQARAAALLSGIQRSDALQSANERLERENRDRQMQQRLTAGVALSGLIASGLLGFLLHTQVRHRRELARQAAILHTLTSNLSDTVLLVDSDLRVQFANRSLRDGSPPPIGELLADVAPNEDSSRFTDAVSAVVRARQASEFDASWRAGDGTMRHYEQRATPIVDGDKLVGVTVRSTDVTAHRQLENALRLQARILDTMNDGVLVLDEGGRITVANTAMHTILGASPTSLIGTSIQSRLTSGVTADERASLVSGTGLYLREVALKRDDDTPCLLAITTASLEADGKRVFVWACRDITWQRHVERALLGASGRDASSAAVSLHEGLAQELTGVSLFLGSTVQQPQSAQVAGTIQTANEYLNTAIRTARNLAQLISPTTPVRGLVGAALNALCTEAALKLGVPVKYDELSSPIGMSTTIGDQIYRMVEDALTASGVTHACNQIRVVVQMSDGHFRIDIIWSLPHAVESDEHFFVRDLQLDLVAHRARLLGGTCDHGQREDGEFLVVRIPLSPAASGLTPSIVTFSEASPD